MSERNRGCGLFSLIVVVLAIFGGYTLYNRWQDKPDSGCAGWETWGRATQSTWDEIQLEIARINPDGATRAEARTLSADLYDARDEQETRTPPPKVQAFHDTIIAFYGAYGDGWARAAETGDAPLTQEMQDVTAQFVVEQQSANIACSDL